MWTRLLIFIGILFITPLSGHAAGVSDAIDGATMNLFWGVPFMGTLLSIALLPLFASRFWHLHFGKISLFWALSFLIPCWLAYGPTATIETLTHTLFLEYFPFIIIIFSLYTVAGGLQVDIRLKGTPKGNLALISFGTLIASLIGTTGASMVLINPLLKANKWRTNKVHIVIFFMFLVANIGGSLSPLGDPPLFLGFLSGVPFFWPTKHLFIPLLCVGIPLLLIFYISDSWFFKREQNVPEQSESLKHLNLHGKVNIVLLASIIGFVLLSGSWNPGIFIKIFSVKIYLQNIVRDLALLTIAAISLKISPKSCRQANHFNWFPVIEVMKLFVAIFVTVAPVIMMLSAGSNGAFSDLIRLATCDGKPNNPFYFWLTGGLSAFLDNAPTYYVFFHMASGDPAILTGACYKTLIAISSGSVFMGAMTYIGNAPNFMVKSIAEQNRIQMPSFFGYLVWSTILLIPLFLIFSIYYL